MVNIRDRSLQQHAQNLAALGRFGEIYHADKAKAQLILARCYGLADDTVFDLDHIIPQSHSEVFSRVQILQSARPHGLEQLRPMSPELNRGRGNRMNFYDSLDALLLHTEHLRERLPAVLPTVEGISRPDPNFPLVEGLGVYFEFDPSSALRGAQDCGDHYALSTELYAEFLQQAEEQCQREYPGFEIDPTLLPLREMSGAGEMIRFDKDRLDPHTNTLLMSAMHADERTVLKLDALLHALRNPEHLVSPYGDFLVIRNDDHFKACLDAAREALGDNCPPFPVSALHARGERVSGPEDGLRGQFSNFRRATGRHEPELAFRSADPAFDRFISALEKAADEFAIRRLSPLLEHKIPRTDLEDLTYPDLSAPSATAA